MNKKIHGGQTYLSRRRLVEDDDQGEEEEEEEEEDKVEKRWWTELYNSDEFRMYDFKVRRCMRVRNHDWTDCPFAHPTEKARRRDPRRYHYSGNLCPSFRLDGMCHRGEKCEFAHGVFEFWLHPSRYRTMPCKDGQICRRKVCFFAHNPNQLRLTATSTPKDEKKPTKTSTLFKHSSYHSFLSPAVSPPAVSSPVITGIVKSMETIELRDPKLGFSWVDQASQEEEEEEEEEEDSVPDLEWVNELVM